MQNLVINFCLFFILEYFFFFEDKKDCSTRHWLDKLLIHSKPDLKANDLATIRLTTNL